MKSSLLLVVPDRYNSFYEIRDITSKQLKLRLLIIQNCIVSGIIIRDWEIETPEYTGS